MDFSLSRLPWYGQVGLFVALALVGIGIFYQFHVSPITEEMAIRQQRLATLRVDIAKASTTAARLNQLKNQLAAREVLLAELKSRLPERKDVADLLRRIQALAAQSNLTIRAFKPAPSVARQLHTEWPIALQLEGTYHRLGDFLDGVSKFPRIINVGDISIRAKDKPDSNSTIDIECIATAFVLLDGAKPAAGKAD
jgi:type IV pilus assembly protein PilO